MTTAEPTRNRKWLWLILGTVTLAYGLLLVRLTGGNDFFNSYPFITDDGFDWLYQGLSLSARLAGQAVPPLPVLRDPGFVLVTALDTVLRTKGLLVLLTLAASLFAANAFLLLILERCAVSRAVSLALLVITLASPLFYFRLFVLSDPLAVALMCGSAWAMVLYLLSNGRRHLVLSAAFAITGALTQTYAAIPFLCGAAIATFARRKQRGEWKWPLVALLVSAVLIGFLKMAWKTALPHESQPKTFGLLQPSLDMWNFYLDLWTLTFAPLAPVLLVAVLRWRLQGSPRASAVLFLASVVAVFAGLTFVYQWREARFTFIYYPLVPMLLGVLSGPGNGRLKLSLTAASLASAVLVLTLGWVWLPANPWEPKLETLAFAPERSWAVLALHAKPVDRMSLAAPQARISDDLSPYAKRIHREYLLLKSRLDGGILTPDMAAAKAWSNLDFRSPPSPCGYLEQIEPREGKLVLRGWAADTAGRVAVCVRAYADGIPVGIGVCNIARPDVVRAFNLPDRLKPGFQLEVPARGAQLRLVAELPDGTCSELLVP